MSDLTDVSASYDQVADTCVDMGIGDLAPHPWLRAALTVFAEHVRGLGPVLDVGCGPGQVTAYLAELGLPVSGVDLSPRMVAHARRRYPDLEFAVGSATDRPASDARRGARLMVAVPPAAGRGVRCAGRFSAGARAGRLRADRDARGGRRGRPRPGLRRHSGALDDSPRAAGRVGGRHRRSRIRLGVQLRLPDSESARPQVVLCGQRPAE